jgi:Selenocysteine lyase
MKCSNNFPALKQKVHGKQLIYFDSAATTHKPESVIEALHRFYAEAYGTVHRAIYTSAQNATEQYNSARETVRAFLNGAAGDEIVFTSGTTEAINLVARCFPLSPGDEVIISETEHHSNIVPWQMACASRGIVLKIIPVTETGELDLSVFEKTLSERTKLVSIAHIANATGVHHPIEREMALA